MELNLDVELDIFRAAEDGDLQIVKSFAEKNINLECRNDDGCTPIHLAAKLGHLEIVKYLVDKGVNFECRNLRDETPFFLAASHCRFETSVYLIEKGADLESRDCDGFTAVHWVARYGCLKLLKFLTDKGVDLDSRNNYGQTPLYLAVEYNCQEIIEYLDSKNVNLENKDNYGFTPFHVAARFGKYNVVKYLFERNVDIECVDVNGFTPFFIAGLNGHDDVVEFLYEKGVDVEGTDSSGRSVVHHAADSGYIEIIAYLADENINLEATDNSGNTPLCLAIKVDFLWVVHFLLDYTFRLPQWNSHIFISEVEETIKRKNASFVCIHQNIRGIHFAKNPVKLECGHLICIGCMLHKISKNRYNILFCCSKYVQKICEKDLIDCLIHHPYKLDSEINSISNCRALLDTYTCSIGIINEKTALYERKLKYVEEEIDIRFQSVKEKLKKIKESIISGINRITNKYKTRFNNRLTESNEYIEALEVVGRFMRRTNMKTVMPKDIGMIKKQTHLFGFEKENEKIRELIETFKLSSQDKEKEELIKNLWINIQDNARSQETSITNLIRETELIIKSSCSINDLESLDSIMGYIVLVFKENKDENAYSQRQVVDPEEGYYRQERKSKMQLYLVEIENKLLKLCKDEYSRNLVENFIKNFGLICNYM